ncbi:MAG: type III pantothenate kinase [Campylobacterota bacterium]|nr:type III pantothenate kinase [Campylobacterota bacterium]
MILCDIGNTSLHFQDGDRLYKESAELFDPAALKEDIYYISVNAELDPVLELLPDWINLAPHIAMDNYYKTMGIDRIMACEAIDNGIIIDAGSAITVDLVRDGLFEGGFIYPGVRAMQKCYSEISRRLDYSFNFELDLDKMPKNSRDAVSYGYLRLLHAEVSRYGLPIYLTGGDARVLQTLFPSAVVDEALIFKGMHKIIEKVF